MSLHTLSLFPSDPRVIPQTPSPPSAYLPGLRSLHPGTFSSLPADPFLQNMALMQQQQMAAAALGYGGALKASDVPAFFDPDALGLDWLSLAAGTLGHQSRISLPLGYLGEGFEEEEGEDSDLASFLRADVQDDCGVCSDGNASASTLGSPCASFGRCVGVGVLSCGCACFVREGKSIYVSCSVCPSREYGRAHNRAHPLFVLTPFLSCHLARIICTRTNTHALSYTLPVYRSPSPAARLPGHVSGEDTSPNSSARSTPAPEFLDARVCVQRQDLEHDRSRFE